MRTLPSSARIPRGLKGRHTWYPCPGWIGDPQPRLGKFERWNKRPQKAHALYWRTHPDLYLKMLDVINRKRERSKNRKAAA